MEWQAIYSARLEDAFDAVYLEGEAGSLYGAGSPVDAVEIFRMSVGSEEIEHYPDVLTDPWAMYHVLDRAFGLEPLLVFDFYRPDGETVSVRYDLLDAEGRRVFVLMKSDEGPVLVLASADRTTLGHLLSTLMLSLLGTDTAFGDGFPTDILPSGVSNLRPDLLNASSIRKGLELLVSRRRETDRSTVEDLRDHVVRFGNPVLRSAFESDQEPGDKMAERDLVDLYFESVYTEVD